MKRTISLLALLFVAIFAYSQTQQGCVKTRGRMINGKHVPGKGLTGAVVTIQDRADVGVKRADGHFSFPVTDKQFMVQTVTKKDYVLVDADAAPKMYLHTSDTLFFLMETPDRLAQDTLDAMRRIRRTLQRQLQEREDEIEALKAEKKISDQEYRTRLQKLHDSQGNNEKLISEMAKRYSMLDYDKLDEFYRQVNYCIEQGELTKADSLLRSRGNVESQIKEQQKKGAAIQQKEKELQEAKEVYKHDNEELARRCYGYYENFKMQHQHDSALYYLELRANIDTTNAEWQFDAGKYCQVQNNFKKSGLYYVRALSIRRRLAESNPSAYEPYVAATLNNLANLYSATQRFSESEQMYKEALSIRRRLAESNPSAYEPYVAMTLNNLAILYSAIQRFSESEQMYKEALSIRRRLAEKNQAILGDYLSVLYSLSGLYGFLKEYKKAYEINEEFIPNVKREYLNNPEQYRAVYAETLGEQSFYCLFMSEFAKSEEYAREGLKIDSSKTFIYSNLAASLLMQGKYSEAENLYRQYNGELKDAFLSDFEEFEKAGIIPKKHRKDVEKIKAILNE